MPEDRYSPLGGSCQCRIQSPNGIGISPPWMQAGLMPQLVQKLQGVVRCGVWEGASPWGEGRGAAGRRQPQPSSGQQLRQELEMETFWALLVGKRQPRALGQIRFSNTSP